MILIDPEKLINHLGKLLKDSHSNFDENLALYRELCEKNGRSRKTYKVLNGIISNYNNGEKVKVFVEITRKQFAELKKFEKFEKKIPAIKYLREITGIGLIEAKTICEQNFSWESPFPNPFPPK